MQIGSTFINMLVKKVDDIMSHMKEINVSDASRVSGQAPKGDYSLEFIQVISAVLALDQNVQQDVLVMRKSLLKYIKVKECAAEAEFLDPGPSFILPNVACRYYLTKTNARDLNKHSCDWLRLVIEKLFSEIELSFGHKHKSLRIPSFRDILVHPCGDHHIKSTQQYQTCNTKEKKT
jgi:hypothetical protein